MSAYKDYFQMMYVFSVSTGHGLYGAITALSSQGLRRDEVVLGWEAWRLYESRRHLAALHHDFLFAETFVIAYKFIGKGGRRPLLHILGIRVS